jgi:hypothetical protein
LQNYSLKCKVQSGDHVPSSGSHFSNNLSLKSFCFKGSSLLLRSEDFPEDQLVNPFSKDVSLLISKIGYLSLFIGIVTVFANKDCDWLVKQGVSFPDLQSVLGGAGNSCF